MKLTSLRLQDFRSYADQSFAFEQEAVIFCGPNGIGKTNILEAISLLSVGKSWREQTAQDLIQIGKTSAQITGQVESGDQYQVQVSARQRRFLKNAKATTRPKFIGQIPTLLFCPEYLQLLTGPKSPRVAFFDRFLVQVDHRYRTALIKANKAHKHKTSLLRFIRAESSPDSIESGLMHQLQPWNQLLAETMPVITQIRQQTLQELQPRLQDALDRVAPTSEPLSIKLCPAETVAMETDAIMNWFERHQAQEIAAAKNFIAPQRDDFQFQLREQPLASTASRGEVRTVLLALLHAQKHHLRDKIGITPILLLDDVFSELDDHRQAELESLCAGSQTFFTTTHREHFDRFDRPVQVFEMDARH